MENKMNKEGILLGYGNPLLDICIFTDQSYLEKYGLKANDAILAEEVHKPMYEELAKAEGVTYIAGGATLNVIRVAQWLIETPLSTTFFGCISNDNAGKILAEKCSQDNVNAKFQFTSADATGTCAVLITGKQRSLCTNLAAANLFTVDHLHSKDNQDLISKAQFYYISSFPLTVCPAAVLEIAQHSHKNGKTFTMNLSAPFLVQFFKDPMMQCFPYIDILFGNETEASVFAKEHKLETENLKEIALKVAKFPKANPSKPRIVVFTQGCDPTIVAQGDQISEYQVEKIAEDEILDTNAAGDAFVGGFLAQLVQGQPIPECVRCAHYAANVVIQHSGCTYPENHGFH